jgi:hypothetical protein
MVVVVVVGGRERTPEAEVEAVGELRAKRAADMKTKDVRQRIYDDLVEVCWSEDRGL